MNDKIKKQHEYLNKVRIYTSMLAHAHTELTKLWQADQANDIDLNDWLSKSYPFDLSFDELKLEICEWVNGFDTALINLENEYKLTHPLNPIDPPTTLN